MKKILFIFLVSLSIQINSQTFVFIPDVNFRAYLQSTIPSAMNGNSLNITSTLVTNSAPTMSVSYSNISNLNGIQYFTSLSFLFCDHNSLTTLPALPNSLGFLECGNNFLTSLPVLPNSLQYLACGDNSLTTLPVLPNSITYFFCRYNHLTHLPALPNSIQNIFCENNSLTNLPTLPTSLLSLWCGNNSINSLPPLPNSLQQLLCYSNSLTSLPALPNSLQALNCGFNNIVCFPSFPDSLVQVLINPNPYNCLPNFVLPAMNNYNSTPLCVPGNANACMVVGLKEINSNDYQINIFPNPTSGQFTIETAATEKQLMQLFDLNGKLLFEQNITGKTTIDATNLGAGIYNLTIKTTDNVTNKKLVIVH